jgi:hypothetical protein
VMIMSSEGFPQQAADDSSISDTELSLHGHGHGPVCEDGAPPTVTQQQAQELCHCQQGYEDSGNENFVSHVYWL